VIPRRKATPRYAQALVQLESDDGVRELIQQLQQDLDDQFPQARVLVRQLEQGPPFNAPIEVRLFGPDLERLQELGEQVSAVLARTPQVIHVRSEMSEALPKLAVRVDEERARLAGLDHQAIAQQLNSTLEGVLGGSVLEATEELPVRVRVSNAYRGEVSNIEALDLIGVRAEPTSVAAGQLAGVPLSALADIELQAEEAGIPHFNGRRMNEVQAYITAGVLPAEVLNDFRHRLELAGFSLPLGYELDFGGEKKGRNDAIENLMANTGVLLVLMIASLVLSLGSFRLAGIIGTVAVMSVGIGLGCLWVFGFPFGFMAVIGTMGLMGVAINDSIVVLSSIQENPRAAEGDPQAVADVVLRATRHVIGTTLTTMVGFLPLVVAGGQFWPPLAITIAAGVAGSTLLALYYVPSAHLLLHAWKAQPKWLRGSEFPVVGSDSGGLAAIRSAC
jgi:multidrug efflux pump subunit AcrB